VVLLRHTLLTLLASCMLALTAGSSTPALAASHCKAAPKRVTHHRHARKRHHKVHKASHAKHQKHKKKKTSCKKAKPKPKPAPQPSPPPATRHPATPPATPPPAAPPPAIPSEPQLFAPDSFWNAPLSADAALAPNSDPLVNELNQIVENDESLNRGPWINTTKWSTPIYQVPDDQPMVHVQLDRISPPLQAVFNAVPLPSDAIPAAGTDNCLVVWQVGTDKMWEFWQLHRMPDGWHASWGGEMDNVSTSPGRYPNSWGGTASSLPLIGGLIRPAELRAGTINHALVMGLPVLRANWWAWPANRTDGVSLSTAAIPAGTDFRLDPTLDIDALPIPRVTKILAHAVQRYGLVVRGTSGNTTLYAEDPTPTGSDPYPALFDGLSPKTIMKAFPWNRLQVLSAPLVSQPG